MTKTKVPREAALSVAEELIALLQDSCERIQVAGSIRRKAPMVSDVELLCIPKTKIKEVPMLGYTEKIPYDALTARLTGLMEKDTGAAPVLAKRPNKNGGVTFGPKNKLLTHLATGIAVDIFTTTHENWGMGLMVRTGPAEWNVAIMQKFKKMGMRGHAYGGVTGSLGNEMECPTEERVFELLNMSYIPPEHRARFARASSI